MSALNNALWSQMFTIMLPVSPLSQPDCTLRCVFVVVKQICHFALLEVLNGNWRLALGYNQACLIVAYRVNELNYCSNDNEI